MENNVENVEVEQPIGKVVRFGKPGPGGKHGFLLGKNENFLTVYTEKEGVVYYNIKHVKHYTEFAKENQPTSVTLKEGLTYVEDFDYQTLAETDAWVIIHLGGPEKVEGVIKSVSDDFIKLVFHEEIIHVAKYHIKSIQFGEKPEEKENAENQSEQSNENSKKEDKRKNNDKGKKGKKEAKGEDKGKKKH